MPEFILDCMNDKEWEKHFHEIAAARRAAGPSPEFAAFMINKPNPPEHVEYMRRASERWPNLPPGAQQNALHCYETLGAKAAGRYVQHATTRHKQNVGGFQSLKDAEQAALKPYHYKGVISEKRRKEYLALQKRYAEYRFGNSGPVEIHTITEYGMHQRLSDPIRCF